MRSIGKLASALLDAKAAPSGLPAGAQPVGTLFAVIVSVQIGTVTITLGGSTTSIAGIKYLSSYSPVAGDTVLVWQAAADLLVIGRLATATSQYRMKYTLTLGVVTLPAATETLIKLDTKITDPSSLYNTGTGIYTVPVAGSYLIAAGMWRSGNAVSQTDSYGLIRRNGGVLFYFGSVNTPALHGAYSNGSQQVDLAVNDTIQLYGFSQIADTAQNQAVGTWMSIGLQAPV